jgi:putative heme iron utilization protein
MPSATPAESAAARLILDGRWAALATSTPDGPLASMVAYAPEPDLRGLFLFLSSLSEHTRNLIRDPRVSLVVTEPDSGTGDPQTVARVGIRGTAGTIDRSEPAFEASWRTYVSRFPHAAPRLGLRDFSLFGIAIEEARYVGGFARAATIPGERLSSAAEQL